MQFTFPVSPLLDEQGRQCRFILALAASSRSGRIHAPQRLLAAIPVQVATVSPKGSTMARQGCGSYHGVGSPSHQPTSLRRQKASLGQVEAR